MKQQEAKILIAREWDRWIELQSIEAGGPTGRESLKFFIELREAQSPLLNFRYKGRDKWQIVHAWLRNAGRIADDGETEQTKAAAD
jgi:hypothetical protein